MHEESQKTFRMVVWARLGLLLIAAAAAEGGELIFSKLAYSSRQHFYIYEYR